MLEMQNTLLSKYITLKTHHVLKVRHVAHLINCLHKAWCGERLQSQAPVAKRINARSIMVFIYDQFEQNHVNNDPPRSDLSKNLSYISLKCVWKSLNVSVWNLQTLFTCAAMNSWCIIRINPLVLVTILIQHYVLPLIRAPPRDLRPPTLTWATPQKSQKWKHKFLTLECSSQFIRVLNWYF